MTWCPSLIIILTVSGVAETLDSPFIISFGIPIIIFDFPPIYTIKNIPLNHLKCKRLQLVEIKLCYFFVFFGMIVHISTIFSAFINQILKN